MVEILASSIFHCHFTGTQQHSLICVVSVRRVRDLHRAVLDPVNIPEPLKLSDECRVRKRKNSSDDRLAGGQERLHLGLIGSNARIKLANIEFDTASFLGVVHPVIGGFGQDRAVHEITAQVDQEQK